MHRVSSKMHQSPIKGVGDGQMHEESTAVQVLLKIPRHEVVSTVQTFPTGSEDSEDNVCTNIAFMKLIWWLTGAPPQAIHGYIGSPHLKATRTAWGRGPPHQSGVVMGRARCNSAYTHRAGNNTCTLPITPGIRGRGQKTT